jgi:hypothetical protein
MPSLDSEMGAAQLYLSTDKMLSGGLCSSASIHYINAEGNITFEVFGDYRQVCARKKVTATQKAIDTLHAVTFIPETIEALKVAAVAYYANKGDD